MALHQAPLSPYGAFTTLFILAITACSGQDPAPFVTPLQRADAGLNEGLFPGRADLGDTLRGTLCELGARRCLSEHSPLSERCDPSGGGFRPNPCADEEICREGRCRAFSCVPDRPICLGTDRRAVCASSGRSVLDVQACSAPQSCRAGECVDLCEEAAESGSYAGCTYFATQLYNLAHSDPLTGTPPPFALIAANPHALLPTTLSLTDARGVVIERAPATRLVPEASYAFGRATEVESQIFAPDGSSRPIPPEARQVTLQPGEAASLLLSPERSGPYLLTSSRPVVAYQFNPYCCNFTATNDASLLLPASSLGLSYRVVNYPAMFLPPGELLTPYISLTATQDDTLVRVDSPVSLKPVAYLSGDTIPPDRAAGEQLEFTLNRGQIRVLTLDDALATYTQNGGDLSGALITSSKPLVAFSGHPCTFVPQDAWACDHLEEQLFPAETLGRDYLLPALTPRNPDALGSSREGVYWRIVAHEDAEIATAPPLSELTTYEASSFGTPHCLEKLNAEGRIALKEGEVCELGLSTSLALQSSAPLIIAGVLSGHQSTGLEEYGTQAGDPAMFLLPPARQFRRQYSFVTSPTFKRTYAAILAPQGAQIGYDGAPLKAERVSASSSVELFGQRWDVLNVALATGLHALQADRPFGLIVYAYDDYVSYAFPGGLNLLPQTKDP